MYCNKHVAMQAGLGCRVFARVKLGVELNHSVNSDYTENQDHDTENEDHKDTQDDKTNQDQKENQEIWRYGEQKMITKY